ncbi:MAG: DUF4258 domain-containing protein [Aliifodinibius sp.]|nr:DUF4258 domain-containing protein [Fodinibius sp.]NIW78754.1 DUF4258 domain-containing protein [Calditrichia bacterium]
MNIIDEVRRAASKRILYLPHAVRQMSRPERMISFHEVQSVIENGELIEDYPEGVRGHSCLLLGFGDSDRPIHVVCAPKKDYLAVITSYLPDPAQWNENFKKRKSK